MRGRLDDLGPRVTRFDKRMKGTKVPPVVLARILPDKASVIHAAGISATVSGEIRCEACGDRPLDMVVFGPGGRISWESDNLLPPAGGAILLDFTYSDKTAYDKDEPVLSVTDAAGQPVLRVTIGRVFFKVTHPPHEFAIDLYLNEAEGSWMRAAISWERLDDGRMYLRTTINDRPYNRAIMPAFPEGRLSFLVGPENVSIRDVAFYDRPLPCMAHPHVNRVPQSNPEMDAVRRLGFVSKTEQAAFDANGGVVLLVPDGALTYTLPCGLRTMGLTRFRIVNDAELTDALGRAAVLVLPDNDFWPPNSDRDKAIAEYVLNGGGLLSIGKSAMLVRALGLVEFVPRTAGCEGATEVRLNLDLPVLKAASGNWMAGCNGRLELLTRRGPLYDILPSEAVSVVATEPLTGLPCAVAAKVGKGRVVLTAAAPFGYYFWHPTFESVRGVAENAARYAFFKALLLHVAAGAPFPENSASPLQELASIPVDPSALGRTRAVSNPQRAVHLGAKGALEFWVRTDTLNVDGPDPRNLVWLSDGGENTLHLYYDPRDQFLVLRGVSPNEESVLYANERTTWTRDAWRHVGFTWQATDTGDAAVELYIDGQLAATGGVPLPTRPWNKMILGVVAGMKGLEMENRGFSISGEPRLNLAAIRRQAVPPMSWDDAPEERAKVERFMRAHRLALLGEMHPNHWKHFRKIDQYGLVFDVLLEKDLIEGRLEKGGYSVLWAPGGGPPKYEDPLGTRNRIRGFLRGGCGYLGICAGMHEAGPGDPAQSLCLYRAAGAAFGGTQLADICLGGDHPAAAGITGAFRDEEGRPAVRFVHMCGSPLRTTDPGADTVAVTTLGMAPALAASGSFSCGNRRGLVWALHPELAGWAWWKPSDRTRYVMRQLFRNSIYYAASAE